jgi:hypothetical protein
MTDSPDEDAAAALILLQNIDKMRKNHIRMRTYWVHPWFMKWLSTLSILKCFNCVGLTYLLTVSTVVD